MTVIIVNRAPQRLRGLLARYCLEVRAGVFVGKVDGRLRDKLWEYIAHYEEDDIAGLLIWKEANEQGFAVRMCGEERRRPVFTDGIWLIEEVQG